VYLDKQAMKIIVTQLKADKQMFLKARQGNIKDEYFFERQVGHGGFGVVYKAKNRNTHRTVAIKAI